MTPFEFTKGYWLYRRMARLALADPAQVLELRERAIHYVDSILVPRVLGVVGSAFRRLGEDKHAGHFLKMAEGLARRVPADRLGLGEILRRRAAVLGDQGNYSEALTLVREALEVYQTYGTRSEIGQALVDCGGFYQFQQRHLRALDSYSAALEKLPFRAFDHRFAALRNSASCHVALGQRNQAIQWAWLASQVEGVAPLGRGELVEMRAELLVIDERFSEAADAYHSAVDLYTEHGFWAQAAVATIQLVKTLQLAGEFEDSLRVAKSSLSLYGHLNSRMAKSAVVTLAKEATEGRQLDQELLDGLLRKLQATR